ncbi:MAG TPA: type II toxin-antitoxin system RelE/ParE family toxin [Verrucomicrobiae bacterium]|nr:type II toxin-antitoxin system RelE/ParE family toxin [Verrucomicrobiae bacterium]
MTTRVIVTSRVRDFLRSLAPEPRRKLWRAIKELAGDKGDVKLLEGKLSGFWRLRIGNIRVIFEVKAVGGTREVFCFYANYRSVVYVILEQLLASGLIEELKRN